MIHGILRCGVLAHSMFSTIRVRCWGEDPMARQTKRLSARTVETLGKPGRHADGDGLYLIVDGSGAKRWAFIFRWREPGASGAGKLREMGLGGTSAVSLADARDRAAEARRTLAAGRNPIEERKAAERAKSEARTFCPHLPPVPGQ
jgi:hypothetical protein